MDYKETDAMFVLEFCRIYDLEVSPVLSPDAITIYFSTKTYPKWGYEYSFSRIELEMMSKFINLRSFLCRKVIREFNLDPEPYEKLKERWENEQS
jgi:hypothetical protein